MKESAFSLCGLSELFCPSLFDFIALLDKTFTIYRVRQQKPDAI